MSVARSHGEFFELAELFFRLHADIDILLGGISIPVHPYLHVVTRHILHLDPLPELVGIERSVSRFVFVVVERNPEVTDALRGLQNAFHWLHGEFFRVG